MAREREESQMTARFLICAAGWMREPSPQKDQMGSQKMESSISFISFMRHP